MAHSRSDEGRGSGDGSKDTAALEPGEAALTPEDVHDVADAAEVAAARPLTDGSGESKESLGTRDHLEDAPSAGETDAVKDAAARTRESAPGSSPKKRP